MDKSPLRKRTDEYYDNRLEDTAVPSYIETRMLNLIYLADDEMRRLWERLEALQLTIAGATTTVSSQDGVLAVETGGTTRSIRELLRSDMKTPSAGPVEQGLECVHQWEYSDFDRLHGDPKNNWGRNWCMKCGALWQSGKILVPVAGPVSSTLVKQPLNESATTSDKAPAPFRLKWCPEMDMGIKHPEHDWMAKTDQGNYWYSCPGNLAVDKPAQSVV